MITYISSKDVDFFAGAIEEVNEINVGILGGEGVHPSCPPERLTGGVSPVPFGPRFIPKLPPWVSRRELAR